jgi:hypothetical protein
MPVISANCLAIYTHNAGSVAKYKINDSFTSISGLEAGATATDDSGGLPELVISSSDESFLGFGVIDHDATPEVNVFLDTTLTLVGAATQSSLELTNTVEDVARDGSGGTLQESTQDWSVTADGLIQVTSDAGETLFDLARDSKYVMVKFSVDKDGTETEYYGQVLLESVSLSGGVDEIATYSVTMRGVDKIYKEA